MMAQIIDIADRRAAKVHTEQPDPAFAPLTRTPELLIIMALIKHLPRKTTGAALIDVMRLASGFPDCVASQEASRIAALLAVTKGDKR